MNMSKSSLQKERGRGWGLVVVNWLGKVGIRWGEEADMRDFRATSSLLGGEEMLDIIGHEGHLSGLPERTTLYLP